jgi:hypothetical protein
MRARTGDRLVIEGAHPNGWRRVGIITAVGRADGLPPYRVCWLDSGHTTLLLPGPNARIEPDPADQTGTAPSPERSGGRQ